MKNCIAICITLAVAAAFWIGWAHKVEVYRAETAAIKTTLSEQGLSGIKVFPLSREPRCYTYNALQGERPVSSTICLEQSE